MSIYRTLDEGPTSELSVQREAIKRKRADRTRPVQSVAVDYQLMRKRWPATEPLPATFKWMARLPHAVRPLAVLRQFPRVANSLAAAWWDREAFRACLYDLLVDKRGNRQGFPADVEAELLALRHYFDECCYPSRRER
jgi:hypothetical protein